MTGDPTVKATFHGLHPESIEAGLVRNPGIVATALHCVSAIPSVCRADPGIKSYLDLPPYGGKAAPRARRAAAMILDRFKLTDRVALVTGAGKGIGRGIALAFAEAGADVVCAARTRADLESTAAEVRARGRRALVVPCDVMQTRGARGARRRGAGGVRPPRRAREQRGRHRAAAGARDQRALLRERAALQRDEPLPAHAPRRAQDGRDGRRRRGGEHLLALERHGADGVRGLRGRQGGAEHGHEESRGRARAQGARERDLGGRRRHRGARRRAPGRAGAPRLRGGHADGPARQVEDIAACALYLASPAASWVTGKVFQIDGGTEAPAIRVPVPPL